MKRDRGARALGRALGLVSAAAALWVFAACREDGPDPDLAGEPEVSVKELGRVGGQIYNEPERAEEILADAGITPEEFEAQVRRVTDDPALSREYTRGFETTARLPTMDAAPAATDSAARGDTASTS